MKSIFAFVLIYLFHCSISYAALDWTQYDIPMGDGMTLSADVYLPDNWTTGPTILIQTPYVKNLYHLVGLPMGIGGEQEEMDYAMVIVDWRGFGESAGALYAGAPTRGEDGYDCVEWIAEQTWSDTKVGTWGPSALGRVQFQTAKEQPPHLVCIVPQVASPLYQYSEYYPGGAARTEYLEQLDALGFGTSPVVYAHPYDDFLWTYTEGINDYPTDITIPTLMIGGWYDHNVETMLPFFQELQELSPVEVQDKHRLVMGPWVHGGSGNAAVGSATQGELSYPEAVGWSDSLAFMFFDFYLKNIQNGWDQSPVVRYFQMGDNNWQEAEAWPVASTNYVRLFFHTDLSLHTALPDVPDDLAFTYDPQDPSPTIGGPTLRTDLDQGPFDQADLVESRNDIVVLSTPELSADVVLKGKATVQVTLTTDVVDTDVAVRLCDVYPDGRSMLVGNGIYRLRFLDGFTMTDENFLTPGNEYVVTVEIPNTAITFKQGHRIRIDVSGSNYPLYNRNMNTGTEMYPNLNGDTLVAPLIANNQIVLSTNNQNGSFVDMPIVGDFPDIVSEWADGQSDFILSPNPAISHFSWTSESMISNRMSISIFDALGHKVYQNKSVSKGQQMDVSSLEAGIYQVKFECGEISGNSKLLILKH